MVARQVCCSAIIRPLSFIRSTHVSGTQLYLYSTPLFNSTRHIPRDKGANITTKQSGDGGAARILSFTLARCNNTSRTIGAKLRRTLEERRDTTKDHGQVVIRDFFFFIMNEATRLSIEDESRFKKYGTCLFFPAVDVPIISVSRVSSCSFPCRIFVSFRVFFLSLCV